MARRSEEDEANADARIPRDLWTPYRVRRCLVFSLRALQAMGGGGGGRSAWMAYLHDYVEAEDPKPLPERDQVRPARIQLSALETTRVEAAVLWQSLYLEPGGGDALALKAWLLSKVCRIDLGEILSGQPIAMSVPTCYRRRDRALGIIGQGLARDGVEPWFVY